MHQELKKKEKELLWELKQTCKKELQLSIPFERMLHDAPYREEVLNKLKGYQHPQLAPILRRLERMQLQPATPNSETEAEILPPTPMAAGQGYSRWRVILLALVLGFATAFWWSQSGLSRWLFPTPETPVDLPTLPVDKPQVVLEITSDQELNKAAQAFTATFLVNSSAVLKEAQRVLAPQEQQWQALIAEQGVLAVNFRLPPLNVPAWRLLEQGIVDILWSQENLDFSDAKTSRFPIGIQGLAAVVARGNALTHLEYAQLQKILSGAIQDWQALPESKVRGKLQVLVTDKNFANSFFPTQASLSSTAFLQQTDLSRLLTQVESNVQHLGLVTFTPQLAAMLHKRALRLLAVRGHPQGKAYLPAAFALLSGDYPLSRLAWLYQNQTAGDFGQRYQSLLKKNAKFLENYGYFSITPQWQSGQAIFHSNDVLPEEYQLIVKNGQRLSLTPTGAQLENSEAFEEIAKNLVSVIRQHPNYQGEVVVVGFSDPQAPAALEKARTQAQQLSRQLLSLGVIPERILAITALPRSLDSKQNQRIEIWIHN